MLQFQSRVITAVTAVAAGLLLLPGAGCEKQAPVSVNSAVLPVNSAVPEIRELARRLIVHGNVESKASVAVSTRTGGVIDSISVEEGSRVKAGDRLFQVDRENLENNVRRQTQQLAVAEAEQRVAVIDSNLARSVLEKAEIDYRRAQTLQKTSAVSADALEKAKLNYESARAAADKKSAQVNYAGARVEQEKAALAVEQKLLRDSVAHAPISGVVTATAKDPGEYVSAGEVMISIENPDALELVSFISSVYYNDIIPGKTVALIRRPGGAAPIELPVTFRGPMVDPASRTFKIKIDLPEKFHFVSGQLCELELILDRRTAPGIPNEAVLDRRNGRRTVFAVNPDRTVSEVEVHTGIVDGRWTELKNPEVLQGRPVVIEGQSFLADGDRVKTAPAPKAE